MTWEAQQAPGIADKVAEMLGQELKKGHTSLLELRSRFLRGDMGRSSRTGILLTVPSPYLAQ